MSAAEASLAVSSLERLVPVPDYQTLPIERAFTGSDALAGCEVGGWYLVAFRSVRREDLDVQALAHHDGLAFAEAARTGGLLIYFKGDVTIARGVCSSACGRTGSGPTAVGSPQHAEAARRTKQWYRWYQIERHALRK